MSSIYERANGKGKKATTAKITSWSIRPTLCAGSIAASPSRAHLLLFLLLRPQLPNPPRRFLSSCSVSWGLPTQPGGSFSCSAPGEVSTLVAGITATTQKHNTRRRFCHTMCTRRMASPKSPREAHTAEPVLRSVTALPNAWRPAMRERPDCHCPLCLVEQKLCAELADPVNQKAHRTVLRSAPHLAVFPTVVDLLSHLQSLDGNSTSDPLLAELLEAKALFPEGMTDHIFVVLFLPVLHATVRRVRNRYPALSREDVAQQALGALLAYIASAPLAARQTYLAFAIARKIRRATFEWAAREARSLLERPRSDDPPETNSFESAAQSFERTALLRHFFARAVKEGRLTPGELDLLVQLKLEGGAENGAFSNAERQRLKRLLGKLRRLASANKRA
jgi:hypothetical protein